MYISNQTKELLKSINLKAALSEGLTGYDMKTGSFDQAVAVRKAVTIATGLTFYDLFAPSQNLYPVITPLRNSIPRVKRKFTGNTANYKQVVALNGSGYNNIGFVPEGGRAGIMSYVTKNIGKNYVTIGEEDYLTFEAEAAAEGFEDENAMVTLRLLQKLMLKEEVGLLCANDGATANGGFQLGTPGTITLSASGSGSTLTGATYYVKVVALSMEGWNNYTTPANGIPSQITVTGADGSQFTVNGGSSKVSAEQNTSVSSTNTLFCSVPAVAGAVAYAWFVGTTSNGETLQTVTTINSLALNSYSTSNPAVPSSLTSTDCSFNSGTNGTANVTAFDGIYSQILSANVANGSTAIGGAYVNSLSTGTAGTGTVLTSSGRGSVVEIDNLLQSMWDNYRLSPTVMYVNSQELKNISNKVLNGTSAPLLRAMMGEDGYKLTASGTIEFYFNPFSVNGGTKLPVKVHPNVPPGTIILWAEQLPEWYQNNEIPNVAEVLTRRDYYRIDWPLVTRQRQYGVYAEETLAMYFPSAGAILTNIANG